MVKDIVVNLPVSGSDVVTRFAASVAGHFGAHLTGVAFVYDPSCRWWKSGPLSRNALSMNSWLRRASELKLLPTNSVLRCAAKISQHQFGRLKLHPIQHRGNSPSSRGLLTWLSSAR